MKYKVGDLIYLDIHLLIDKTRAGPHVVFATSVNHDFYLILWSYRPSATTSSFRWVRPALIDHIKSKQLQ